MKITIKQSEYDKLIKDANWLQALEDAGVDNWGGMEHAISLYQERFPNEEDK